MEREDTERDSDGALYRDPQIIIDTCGLGLKSGTFGDRERFDDWLSKLLVAAEAVFPQPEPEAPPRKKRIMRAPEPPHPGSKLHALLEIIRKHGTTPDRLERARAEAGLAPGAFALQLDRLRKAGCI